MPPAIDLTKTYTRADMILSSRNGPARLNLRRAASYNASERGQQSSTSSRFSFQQLIASPPPSPGLPALVPRHGKVVSTHRISPRRCARLVGWCLGILSVLYWCWSIVVRILGSNHVEFDRGPMGDYEIMADTRLPGFPTPVMVTDKKGRAKWTVSIPPDSDFPLEPKSYAEMCEGNIEVASRVADLHTLLRKHKDYSGYYHVDPNFLDVKEAEQQGLLPGPEATTNGMVGTFVGQTESSSVGEVCQKTLTYVMETEDAGLGGTLMMLWMSYGLAKKEGRSFFVDDTRWAYGEYTTYFQAPPIPDCRPPPRHEILPCPHHARHLLVSASTSSYTFGHKFKSYFSDLRKDATDVKQQRGLFDLARKGYEDLWDLKPADSDYLHKRLYKLRKQSSLVDSLPGKIVGVHVRHGDNHPVEFEYQDSYVPLDHYLASALSFLPGSELRQPEGSISNNKIIVASDDPTVYESEEFAKYERAQELIRLTANPSPVPRPANLPAIRPFFADSVGWEGGFFSGMFWSLGQASNVPATTSTNDKQAKYMSATAETFRLRELVGRAYLLDLAMVGSSDAVVCTGSSMAGKVLGVMMGWNEVASGKWKNVDGGRPWAW
ncbi:hypothetical protein BJ878DRAFT_158874 [Calycina marina]|uniref:Uncharacterized protein n=1 Tax=Calycina marina TaxID=1763456 RepID=A0A9P7YZS8_9HELO|nr:hypothetical protein BJ878DRAFT_158874 [Calycina marina]